jgi:CheY-like chemotaxis protein
MCAHATDYGIAPRAIVGEQFAAPTAPRADPDDARRGIGPMSVEPVMTRALLVCRDIPAIEILCHCAQQLSIQVEICPNSASATGLLCHSKFESVIVDLASDPAARELITKLHAMTSHKKAVIFAICDGEEQTRDAFKAGAMFSLERHASPMAVLRTLRAAYPMMVAERRRYFRYPMETTVFVKKGSSTEFKACTVNLSEAGMAILSSEPLSSDDHIQLRFCLPSTTDHLSLAAEVCWTNADGRAGLKFERVARAARECLQNWLSARFEECTPPVATKVN